MRAAVLVVYSGKEPIKQLSAGVNSLYECNRKLREFIIKSVKSSFACGVF